MNIEAAENKITSELAEKLAASGFRKQNNFLIARDLNGVIEQVRCGVRKDQVKSILVVSLMIGIRFEAVESIWQRSFVDPDCATIAEPIHLLAREKNYTEWDVGKPETGTALFSQIKMYAVPFFEKYTNLSEVSVSLRSENPRDWFGLGPDMRIEPLSIILALNGEKKYALSLLDQKIASLRDSHIPPSIAQRLRFQKLKDKLSLL